MQSLYGMLVPPPASQGHPGQQQADAGPALGAGVMAPPPDQQFQTRDDLLNYLKTWAASQGYAVVIGRSRTNRLWIRCDRGGEYRDKHADNPAARKRKRKESRLTGCAFSIKASMRKDGIWRCRCEYGQHNHGPSEDLREHPSLRRMTDQQLAKVNDMTQMGKTPAEIMDELNRIWPDIKVIRRDIYNARKNLKTNLDPSDSASASASAPASATTSAPASLNASFEDPGRMAATNDSGRWHWPDDDHIPTKKRKLGPSSRDSDGTATPSFASTAADGPSAQIPLESMPNAYGPQAPTPPLPDQSTSVLSSTTWSRAPLAAPSHRQTLLGQSPFPADARTASGTPMRSVTAEFAGTATSHLGSSTTPMPHNTSFYQMNMPSPQRYPPPPPPPPLPLPDSPAFSRPANQSLLHPSHRNPQISSPGASPAKMRRPSHSLPPAPQPIPGRASQPATITAPPPPPPPTRPPPSTQQASASELSRSAPTANPSPTPSQPQDQIQSLQPPQSQPQPQLQQVSQQAQHQSQQQQQQHSQQGQQQQKAQSGVVIMQRMQRMEDELMQQKTMLNQQNSVLNQQNNMLNQILAVVQGLSGGGNGSGAGISNIIGGSARGDSHP